MSSFKIQHHLKHDQKTVLFVFRWLRAQPLFDITRFRALIRAPDIISIVLLKHQSSRAHLEHVFEEGVETGPKTAHLPHPLPTLYIDHISW